jgi:CBS domain-containing protein
MKAAKLCKHPVVIGHRDMTIKEAAALMRAEHVGALVIVDGGNDSQPVGMLTDRDIVVGGVALGLDLDVITAEMLMADNLVVVRASDTTDQVFSKMRVHGTRRMPVVGNDGALVGIVTMDDLIEEIGKELTTLGKSATNAGARESKRRATLSM